MHWQRSLLQLSRHEQMRICETRRSICTEFWSIMQLTMYLKSGHISASASSSCSDMVSSLRTACMGRNSRPFDASAQTTRVRRPSGRKLRICILKPTVRPHSDSSLGMQSYGSCSARFLIIRSAPLAIRAIHMRVTECRQAMCLPGLTKYRLIYMNIPYSWQLYLQRRIALNILDIAIGTGLQQHCNSLQSIVMQRRPVQHGVVIIVTYIRIGIIVDQQAKVMASVSRLSNWQQPYFTYLTMSVCPSSAAQTIAVQPPSSCALMKLRKLAMLREAR